VDTLAGAQLTNAQLRRRATMRRLAFFALTFITAAIGGFLMFDILRANGLTYLEFAGLLVFFFLFTWIGGAFWTAIAGFVLKLLRHRDPVAPDSEAVRWRPLVGRTAIVMPVYNEDVERIAAGVSAIWASLRRQPQEGAFDFFILSDTRRTEIAAEEMTAWRRLVSDLDARGRLFYRRRSDNTGRKAGNIADFVCNWGGAYDYMLVLDADSIMSGSALVRLAQIMDSHPQVGIVQSLPLLAGNDTLFARLLQFAVRLNGPMFAAGLAFWQLGDSNYWGHNAILRMRAFADHCALPRLPGSPPFGGEIMSHDFVEAAFIRRAGYEVWLLPELAGSWEEVPSNIVDFAARDRRWTQGNLQHVGVLPLRGLHWMSRLHMFTGILSYASSPLWLLGLILTSIVTCLENWYGHQYFKPGIYSLFPTWPQYRDSEIVLLLSMTVTVLMLPKLLGGLITLRERTLRRAFGGGFRLLAGMLLEQLLSMLLAPVMMLFHSTFVVSTLLGHPVSWDAQPRGDRGISFREAWSRHRWHVFLGLIWGATIVVFAPKFIFWMLPVLAGMVLSVPLTMLTSRSSVGRRARSLGLLLTPEETAPPPELAALRAFPPRQGPPDVPSRPFGPEDVMTPPSAPLTMRPEVASYVRLPQLLPGPGRMSRNSPGV
jgi:membrane glycosyltransferase